jgi:uncharacterized membrane protein
LRAVAIVILVLLGIGLAGQYFFAKDLTQPISEIGILGPNGEFTGYPQSMTVGMNYTLELYVANHSGQSMLYQVYEKVGSSSSVINQTTPLDATPAATYWFALPNNGTVTQPITVNVPSPGNDTRLVWELWFYSTPTGSWTYDGAWAQLIVNATEP